MKGTDDAARDRYFPLLVNRVLELSNATCVTDDPKGRNGDEKIYCPGIGLVMDEDLELVDIVYP